MIDRGTKKGALKRPQFADNTIKIDYCIGQIYNYIPVDYIKCLVIGLDIDHFKQNMTLTEYESKKENKSKYLYYENDNIKIKCFVESGRIELSGSLHKFFYRGLQNYGIFTHENYLKALERLKYEFGVEPKNLQIIQLEYGVNIKPPIETKKILDNLMRFKSNEVENKLKDNRKSHFNQFRQSKFIIKVYDKAIQYNLKDDLIRVEIKHTNWSEYRTKNKIITLDDFNQLDKSIFINNLINKWNEIIFYDPTIKTLDKFNKYSNHNFWNIVSPKQISKHRQRLNHLIKTQSQNIKQQIANEILKHIQGVQKYRLSKKRYCKLTGVDITTQRDKSFLLSHQGLRQLKKTTPKEYKRIESIFLSDKWQLSSTNKKIKEIAHNIRSKYNYQQKRNSNQMSIFNIDRVQKDNFIYT